ncbi:class I SAM-dependent methyltransferase [Bradyrhizobium liaoningense]|uniref:class I SAM-dependent methyltransferase n=1 Tax=Bradyrhizobium liaoningense TaxID=43992 RepID=UPI001BA5238B|nr:class I SAM-dependent methyltransferase [Bradyrhizobium liaoningense]MBR0838963.1 class I SAM-dependent methyltransferase [Bradyrhizobium liaoningense]
MLAPQVPDNRLDRSNTPVNCLFCRHPKPDYWFSKRSKHNGRPYPLFTCSNCGGAFVFPVPSEQELHEFYSGTQSALEVGLRDSDPLHQYDQAIQEEVEFPNSTVDAKRIAENLKRLAPGMKALDVGSGYGFFSKALMEAGFSVDAIELGEASRKIHARMTGFEPKAEPFNADFARRNAGLYDAVLLSQVLEHLPMDADPIRSLNVLLRKGGICAIAIPHFRSFLSILQGKNDMFIVPPEHVNFFTVKGLNAAFASRGFQTMKCETVSKFDYRKFKKKFGPLSPMPSLALKGFLGVSSLMDKGMFVNGYFRKL